MSFYDRHTASIGLPEKPKWLVYIPDEGHWPIDYYGDDEEVALVTYLEWADRTDLPEGAFIARAE